MTPLNGLWERVTDWENLLSAYRKARRGKADRREVQRFALELEYELFSIARSLRERRYEPGSYRQFWIKDRKRRLISAAPFRDRVIQHALMNVVEPLLDRRFTSQFLGNLYLDDLDHFIKETLGVPAYLRYVDDLTLLSDDKPQLWRWCRAIEGFLAGERLAIHARKRWVVPVRCGIDLLGYRVFPRYVRLCRGSGYRFRRRFRSVVGAYAAGRLSLAEVRTHVAGWLGHACQADTQGLRRAVLSSVSF